jgi:hypothetical protein
MENGIDWNLRFVRNFSGSNQSKHFFFVIDLNEKPAEELISEDAVNVPCHGGDSSLAPR